MRCVINTNVVSLHQTPLALELARILGKQNVAYCYHGAPSDPDRSKDEYRKITDIAVDATNDASLQFKLSVEADLLIENVRDFDVMEERARKRRPTFYVSERWFKPVRVDSPGKTEYAHGRGVAVSGFLKLFLPFAFKRARRMVRLMRNRDNKFLYLPAGIHAGGYG